MTKRSPALLFVLLNVLLLPPLMAQHTLKTPGGVKPTASFITGFEQLREHFHKYVDRGIFAGTSILLSQDGKMYSDTYGYQHIADEQPLTGETIFRLASMTKPITSVAILMLMEEGKLDLDDPVFKYIPAFEHGKVYRTATEWEPVKNPLTIRHLLTHTGGITSGFDPSPAGQLWARTMRERKPKNLEELVLTLAELPLAFQPGEGWAYSYSTDILAYIVEKASGLPFDQFLAERIFKPLKMQDTGFQVPSGKIDRFAALYVTGEDQQLQVADAPQTSPYTNGTYYPRGNGGLTATITDYSLFAKMLLNGGELNGVRLLQKNTVDLMTKNHLPDHLLPISIGGEALMGYGFGLGVGVLLEGTPFGTAGEYFWPGAAYTYFMVNPEKQGIALFMTQLSDMKKRYILEEFHDMASKVFCAEE